MGCIMSKNISIQEGGTAKQLTVDKLITHLVNSGTCLWVPEDEVQLTTKTITENGTYKASDDGYYGYEQVIVSIANAGIATGTDGDGDEAVAYTDPETGGIVTDKAPSSIEVVTPPTNPYGIYTSGQAITTDGMVVKAYLKTGVEYGTVPNMEITLNPTTAVYDASTDMGGSGEATSSLDTGTIQQPISYVGVVTAETDTTEIYYVGIGTMTGWQTSQSNVMLIGASSTPGVVIESYSRNKSSGRESEHSQYRTDNTYTYDGKTVYYALVLPVIENPTGVTYNADAALGNYAAAAWTMIYGNRTEQRTGSHQTITVTWPRPRDGKELTTTFGIRVKSASRPRAQKAASRWKR